MKSSLCFCLFDSFCSDTSPGFYPVASEHQAGRHLEDTTGYVHEAEVRYCSGTDPIQIFRGRTGMSLLAALLTSSSTFCGIICELKLDYKAQKNNGLYQSKN